MPAIGELIQLLAAYPAAYIALAVLFGLLVGSFLNVVIHRLPIMMERQWQRQCKELLDQTDPGQAPERFDLILPRSKCPACGHTITALENIPILSYVFLGGRCSSCGTRISPRYVLVEALAGAVAGFAAWHFGIGWQALGAMALSWGLIALTFIDLRHQLLPDDITLPFLWAGLLLSIPGLFVGPVDSIVGAAAGYLSLWLVYWAFKLLRNKEGMGYGDFKLLAMLGAWLGWQMVPIIILLSSLVGSVAGIALILFKGHERQAPIPFGPYLAGAGLIALFWGTQLKEMLNF